MARNSDETIDDNDRLDQLLRGFQTRNEFRSDPNYVLEPVEVETPLSDRFIKILRESSLGSEEEDIELAEPAPAEQETNTGLVLLAEQYDKNSQKKQARAKAFSAFAALILLTAVIIFAALAEFLIVGIIVAIVAGGLLLFSRSSAKQAQEIQQIAAALAQPEETS